MTFEKAKECMQDGLIVQINGWKYRQELGHCIQRLNGWWQNPTWPITAEEMNSDQWELAE